MSRSCRQLPTSPRLDIVRLRLSSPPLPVPVLLCQAQRALRRRSPIVSWEKLPEASVEEMRWVGACRLKYLQRRHAMASFIRCLTRRTRKLSAVLNQSQILFFIWHSHIYFAPSFFFFVFFFKGIMSLFEIARTLTPWFTSFRIENPPQKNSNPFNTIRKHIMSTKVLLYFKKYWSEEVWSGTVTVR